jgi:transposase
LKKFQLAEIQSLLGVTADQRARERLQVALWAANGQHTLEDLAKMTNRARATIQLWLDKFRVGGINGLVNRDTPPGSTSPIAAPSVQAELAEGLRTGRWRTARDVATWLKATHGIERAKKSVYYWLAKGGWRLIRSASQARLNSRKGAEKRGRDSRRWRSWSSC